MNGTWASGPSVPGLNISLSKYHGSCLCTPAILSEKGRRPVSLPLADAHIDLLEVAARRRGAVRHDSGGSAELAIVEARIRATRGGIVISLLELRRPGTTLRHGGRMVVRAMTVCVYLDCAHPCVRTLYGCCITGRRRWGLVRVLAFAHRKFEGDTNTEPLRRSPVTQKNERDTRSTLKSPSRGLVD